jgi:hypothetical protein
LIVAFITGLARAVALVPLLPTMGVMTLSASFILRKLIGFTWTFLKLPRR